MTKGKNKKKEIDFDRIFNILAGVATFIYLIAFILFFCKIDFGYTLCSSIAILIYLVAFGLKLIYNRSENNKFKYLGIGIIILTVILSIYNVVNAFIWEFFK